MHTDLELPFPHLEFTVQVRLLSKKKKQNYATDMLKKVLIVLK